MGAGREDLMDVYCKQIRSIVEYAAPVWHSSFTGEDRLRIERIQKSALRIALEDDYKSYTSALRLMQMDTLFRRQQKLSMKFAKKCLISKKFSKWFKTHQKVTVTRGKGRKFCKVYSRTLRYELSPINYITELLNRTTNIK